MIPCETLQCTGDHLDKIQALEMMLAIMGDIVDTISLDLQTNIASSSHFIMEASHEIIRGKCILISSSLMLKLNTDLDEC